MKRYVFYRAWSGFLGLKANRGFGPESLVPLGSATPGVRYPWGQVPLGHGTPGAWYLCGLGS